MKTGLKKTFDEVDLLIRDAGWELAKARLLALKPAKMSQPDLIRFASLCRRSNIPSTGISALRPLIRPTKKNLGVASPESIVEYACGLVRLGAVREAESLLRKIDFRETPSVHEAMAFLRTKEWDYHLAIPHCREHLKRLENGSYASSIAKLNLVIALYFEAEFNEAAEIIQGILSSRENFRYKLLQGNCYRVLGNLEFSRKNFALAAECFQKAYQIFSSSVGIDEFLVRKWIALVDYFHHKGSAAAQVTLDGVRHEALRIQHWESLRDIDYQLACYHRNEPLLVHLYYGTPFGRFKWRINRDFPELSIPADYHWKLGDGDGKRTRTIDFEAEGVEVGTVLARLYYALTADFYRPMSAIDLFQKIHPDEFYSHGSSENRVHQALLRFKALLKKAKLPMFVENAKDQYRLRASERVDLLIRNTSRSNPNQLEHRVGTFKEKFGSSSFTAKDVEALMGKPRRTVSHILSEATEAGLLVRTGSGKATRYAISERSSPVAVVKPAA